MKRQTRPVHVYEEKEGGKMRRRVRYREAFVLACELTWYLFRFSLAVLGLPSLVVHGMSAFRHLELFIAVLLMVFAVLPASFQSLIRHHDSDFRLVIIRPDQGAPRPTYLESLQVALVSSAVYTGFIAAFQQLRLADRVSLTFSNLICFSLLVLVISPPMVLTVIHFPFRGFRLMAEPRSATAASGV